MLIVGPAKGRADGSMQPSRARNNMDRQMNRFMAYGLFGGFLSDRLSNAYADESNSRH
jgi:hypothetical protein